MSHWKIFSQKSIYNFTIFLWIFVTLFCLVYLFNTGDPFKIGAISDPNAESTTAQNIINKKFPYSGSKFIVLYQSNNLTVYDSKFKSYIDKSISNLKELSFKNRVISPYTNTKQISSNKHVAYAVIETELTAEKLAVHINAVKKILGDSNKIQVLVGGEPAYVADINYLSEKNLVRSELIALPICFIIMIFVFGGVAAALITILCGVISIIIITTILYFLANYIDLSVYVLNIASMLGLGLCLDYTLLITYRFREEWACYNECKPTIRITLANSGKAILFSGIIVLICMGSLMFFPINVLHSMGIAGIIIVLITMLCCLTFLPAILCLFEKRINSSTDKLQEIFTNKITNPRWYQFALLVMKYPIRFLIPTIIILSILGYPFLSVKLNNSDAKILPSWTESRKVMDKFDKYFHINELQPITIVLKSKNKSILSKENIASLYDYVQRLKKDSKVKKVSSIVTLKPDLNKQQY